MVYKWVGTLDCASPFTLWYSARSVANRLSLITGTQQPRVRKRRLLRDDELVAWLIVLPWVIGFLLFHLGPILASLFMSLTDWPLLASPKWVGLANFRTMLWQDPLVWQALKVTTLYALGSIPLQMMCGLFVAVLLNQPIRAQAFMRTVYYLPSCVSGVSVALLWLWVFSGDHGLLNSVLRLVGIAGPYWLSDTNTVLPAFIIMGLWGIGGGVVIYLAGLQGVPTFKEAFIDSPDVYGIPVWMHEKRSEVEKAIDDEFQLVWTGKRTVEEAANAAKPKVDALLKSVK